jgi:hypothetical protein
VVSDKVNVYHPGFAEGSGCGVAGVLVGGTQESAGVIEEGVSVVCVRGVDELRYGVCSHLGSMMRKVSLEECEEGELALVNACSMARRMHS